MCPPFPHWFYVAGHPLSLRHHLHWAFVARGGNYDWILCHQFAQFAALRVPLLAGARIIDIATGTGTMAVSVAARACRDDVKIGPVVALDLDDTPLAALQRNAERCSVDDMIVTVRQDAHKMTWEDGTFDVATSVFGITIMRDPRAAAREMVRVLVPGGTALVMCWASTPITRAFVAAGRDPGHFYEHGVPVLGATNVSRLLADAGLDVVQAEETPFRMNYIGLLEDQATMDELLKRLALRSSGSPQRDRQMLTMLYDPTNPLEDIDVTVSLVVATKPST